MSSTIEEIAGKHLGKAGDGTLVKPYTTPEKHDRGLLVPLPRSLNREKSKVTTETVFTGYEVWHAYEMSFLQENGMPTTGILKLTYPSDSEAIVESKSLKLYLNSFDLEKFSSSREVESIIEQDLSEAVGGKVEVVFHVAHEISPIYSPFHEGTFMNWDSAPIDISEYKENANLLQESDIKEISFHTANLRSNCEITNQKDTGNCYIYMRGSRLPQGNSLMRYVISMRESQHFHENVTEIMFDTLYKKFSPSDLFIGNIYNRRGGIDIHCVRATSDKLIHRLIGYYEDVNTLFQKTAQQ